MITGMNIFSKAFMRTKWWVSLSAASLIAFNAVQAQPAAPENTQPVVTAGETQPPPAVAVNVSPAAAEVVRLSESGVSQEVVLAFIQNSQTNFDLTADDVLYLKDVGVAPEIVTAMLNHDSGGHPDAAQLANNPTPQTVAPQPGPSGPPAGPGPAVEAPLTPRVEMAEPAYVSTPPPAEVNYFYNDLSPYGTWVMLDGVGWCWQPRTVVISRGWRPYCDGGHWVYSDCGWYWQSDYSWGWAPFHYGRWYMHDRCGWVWTPDRTWGPAWVSWRVAGDSCGWAPLPPHAVFDVHGGWRYNGVHVGVSFDFGLRADHFTFVAVRNFDHRDLRHDRLPPTEVRNGIGIRRS